MRAVHLLLVGCRKPALAAIEKGMGAMLGGGALKALTPEELACRLLGYEQPSEALVVPRAEGAPLKRTGLPPIPPPSLITRLSPPPPQASASSSSARPSGPTLRSATRTAGGSPSGPAI